MPLSSYFVTKTVSFSTWFGFTLLDDDDDDNDGCGVVGRKASDGCDE